MKASTIFMAVVLTLIVLCPSGCGDDPNVGYTTKPLHPTNIKTVDVPIWTRGQFVYRRRVEYRVTEALKKQIELDTRYRIATKGRADTQLVGCIDLIEQRVLSFDPDTGLPREMEITFVVSFKWRDLGSGKLIKEYENVRVAGTYIPLDPLGEDFFQGSEDVINKLAKRVVEYMESDW